MSKAVEVMIQHVENLKRMYAKEHAELEELKQVLLQNERSFAPLEDEGNGIYDNSDVLPSQLRVFATCTWVQKPCPLVYSSLQLQL